MENDAMTSETEKREFEAGIDWVARTNEAGRGFLLSKEWPYVRFLAEVCWEESRTGKFNISPPSTDKPELNDFLAGVEVGRKMLL